jgi:hypothetical protein
MHVRRYKVSYMFQHIMGDIVSDVTHDVLKNIGDFLTYDVLTFWCM